MKGVEIFFSSVGGVTTNATRKAKSQVHSSNVNGDNEGNPATEEVDKAEKEKETTTVDVNKEDNVFPSIVCKNSCAETANRLHKALHEAQTEVEIKLS